MRFYQMLYSEDRDYEQYGVAYASPDVGRFLLPLSGTEVESWTPLSFDLREGAFADYLANNLGARLCSQRLRETIERNLSPNDHVQWLEVYVRDGGGNCKGYFVLHFPQNRPVVNEEKSLLVGDMVIKPVFKLDIVKEHRVFTLPGAGGPTLYVSGSMKEAIEERRLSGMAFSIVSAAD